jgi:hypothetical protein
MLDKDLRTISKGAGQHQAISLAETVIIAKKLILIIAIVF